MMQKIGLALLFGFVFGTMVLGADPATPAADVQLPELVNFDAVFQELTSFFMDILKEYWVLMLSVFFLVHPVNASLVL
jgi:succinate dehydrogenase/fumarate reductase cytochrome b subunit